VKPARSPELRTALLVFVATVLLVLVSKALNHSFGSFSQLSVILSTSVFLVIVAFGQGLTILLGGIDLFFLNAGISTGTSVGPDFDLERYRRAMGVNLDGVVFGVQAALPVLGRRGGGSIVATASMAGLTGTPFDPVYGANKHAVVGLVRALGPTLAPQNITVNAFCPGFAETGIITDIRGFLTDSGVPIIPVEVAGAAVLQAFDSSETGQAWLLQAGREVMTYRFRGIPGPLAADGTPARPADPSGVPA